MSIRVMTQVWDRSAASGTALLLLLAIADVVDDHGTGYAGQTFLAAKARVSERTVRRLVDELVATGELEIVRRGGRQGDRALATVYRVRVDVLEANRPIRPVGNPQPDTERVPTGQNALPNRTPVSALPSVPTSVVHPHDDSAREQPRLRAVPAPSLADAVGTEASTDVRAKVDHLADALDDEFLGWQHGALVAALLEDEAGVVALVEHARAHGRNGGYVAQACRRGKHVGFAERAATPAETPRDRKRREANEAAARFLAKATRWQA